VFLKEYKDVEFLKQIVVSIRNIRAELGVMPAQKIKILIHPESDKTHDLISDNKHFIYELAGVDSVEFTGDEKPKNCVTQVLSGVELFVPVEGIIDLDSEISRMNREVSKIDVDLKFIEDKLNNKKFIERAPKEIVEKEKNKFKELSDNKSRMLEVLNRLSQIK
jgi:valyl-tRNA synthetase